MTTVRIAHAEPMPGRLGNGEFQTRGYLVVLTDDEGHRAVPIWLRGEPGEDDLSQLAELASRPAGEIIVADVPENLAVRLLHAADASVAGVDIDVTAADMDELNPQVTVARVGLRGPTGTRQVTASLGLGLAMAVASGAPVRVPDAVMERLAVPVTGEDLLTPFLDHVPPSARALPGHGLAGWPMGALPAKRPRFEPRNLDFADGLDRWDLDSALGLTTDPWPQEDYSAVAEGQSAVLSSAVARPAGSAALVQAIFADDYRGATVVFHGEVRTESLTGQAGLRLEILRHWWRTGGDGLAAAAAAHAPIRVSDTVMSRLAVPEGSSVPGTLPAPTASVLRPGNRPRYEPRNMRFADGLDRWLLGGSFAEHTSESHWHDYTCAAGPGVATLSAAVPQPGGFAFLAQEMFADDYIDAVITFSGQVRISRADDEKAAVSAGLFLRTERGRDTGSGRNIRGPLAEGAVLADPSNHIVTVIDGGAWARHEVTARVPGDCTTVMFGVFLTGPGRVELRDAELRSR